MFGGPSHWDKAWTARPDTAQSWFEETPERTLALISERVGHADAVIDIGGGASRLVDGLLAQGFTDVAVLDLSGAALAISMARLGTAAEQVDWYVADITRWTPPRLFRFWHDRAVFHFLTEPEARAAYVAALLDGVAPGGFVALTTFADDGPELCSGLRVSRYAPEGLAAELERLAPGALRPVRAERHVHLTPLGREQKFQTSLFERVG